jgi:hypothetical protein
MVFKIGNKANPNGRPRKKPDPRSLILEEMCKKHTDNIEKIVDVLIKKAMSGEDRAIKLVTDMFIPKAGTYAPVEKNTTQNNLNVHMSPILNNTSQDEHSELWQLLMRAKNRTPAVINVTDDDMK